MCSSDLFEVGPENVGSGGIVRDAALQRDTVDKIIGLFERAGFTVAGEIPSPVTGGDGNREFLLHLQWKPKQASQGVRF